jgi:hypothetical protein
MGDPKNFMDIVYDVFYNIYYFRTRFIHERKQEQEKLYFSVQWQLMFDSLSTMYFIIFIDFHTRFIHERKQEQEKLHFTVQWQLLFDCIQNGSERLKFLQSPINT